MIGYVDLSAEENADLEETTDREGFKRTAYFQNFMRVMEEFRAFTERAQSFIRRQYVEYRKVRTAQAAGLDEHVTPEAISRTLGERLSGARRQLRSTGTLRRSLERLQLAPGSRTSQSGRSDLSELPSLIDDAVRATVELETYISSLVHQQKAVSLLQQQIEDLREQLAMTYETVALGLTAEAFSHEVHNVADRLAQRTSQIRTYMDQAGIRDLRVRAYLEHVRTTIAALNRQLGHLNPALRYLREQRESIKVNDFLADLCAYYGDLWRDRGVKALLVDGGQDFTLSMNRGKLTQILDNLFLNSEYWLRDIGGRRAIYVEAAAPLIKQWDTGPGVDPVLEASLFEPFVTAKPPGSGRGLGLYVIHQLLESEGAEIRLSPERNEAGRRFRFEIDFPVLE